MRARYYTEPPRRPNWLERLKEPPWNQVLIAVGIALALYLIIALPRYGARVLILLIAFPIHELAHAFTAYRLGDSTPKYDGRLTLNPFAHLELFGSILIMVAGLGWAKPVRFNPSALRMDANVGAMIVAAAGPLSNLVLAVLMAMLWRAALPFLQMAGLGGGSFDTLLNLFYFFAFINVVLFFFNLIPLAPLDGFTVLSGLLPRHLAYQLQRVQPYSFLIFLLLFVFGGPVLGLLIFRPSEIITQFLFGF